MSLIQAGDSALAGALHRWKCRPRPRGSLQLICSAGSCWFFSHLLPLRLLACALQRGLRARGELISVDEVEGDAIIDIALLDVEFVDEGSRQATGIPPKRPGGFLFPYEYVLILHGVG